MFYRQSRNLSTKIGRWPSYLNRVSEAIFSPVLYFANHQSITGHPGKRRMYETLTHEYHWPDTTNGIYATVARCMSLTRNGCRRKHMRPLQLFSPWRPLEFVCMFTSGPLQQTTQKNQIVIVMTNKYSKWTRAVPSAKKGATRVANNFLDHWTVLFRTPSCRLTDNGQQFVRKFFVTICGYLGVKHLTITAYNPLTNEQLE